MLLQLIPFVSDKSSEELNLSDLNLKKLKLTEEDALALSYLTPGLSRRIQKQLLAQLPPSEARKISRTLSMRSPYEDKKYEEKKCFERRSVDRVSSTLPRRYSLENGPYKHGSLERKDEEKEEFIKKIEYPSETNKSNLPIKSSKDYIKSRFLEESFNRRDTSMKSPDSSLSECYSYNDDSSFRRDGSSSDFSSRLSSNSKLGSYSLYSPDSSSLNKYLSPKTYESYNKSENRNCYTTPRKISRFLRPDFYDQPKEENILIKEKKEREMETQKVLKEIRDKRIKNRVNTRRERSASREPFGVEKVAQEVEQFKNIDYVNVPGFGEEIKVSDKFSNEDNQLSNDTKFNSDKFSKDNKLSNNKKLCRSNIEDNKMQKLDANETELHDYVNIKGFPDYVNVSKDELTRENINVPKKDCISKLVRPKSYPAENYMKTAVSINEEKIVPEKEKSKICKLKKNADVKEKNGKENKSDGYTPNKNKFLQSFEKKFEKLKSFGHSSDATLDDKKSKEKNLNKEGASNKQNVKSAEVKSYETKPNDTKIYSAKTYEPKTNGLTSKEIKCNEDKSKETKFNEAKSLEAKSVDKKFKELKTNEAKLESRCTEVKSKEIKPKETKSKELKSKEIKSKESKSNKEERKSAVESTIRKLREQSLPKNLEHCATESSLIKRAVSVEDLSTLSSSSLLQPSRKSVSKILGLFKKYEEKEKGLKVAKKKPKEGSSKKSSKTKEGQAKDKKNEDNDSRITSSKVKKNEENTVICNSMDNLEFKSKGDEKLERKSEDRVYK